MSSGRSGKKLLDQEDKNIVFYTECVPSIRVTEVTNVS